MLRSLRGRLILSHVLPTLVIAPVLWFALVYMVETQFLLPQLADNLAEDARLLSEITRAEQLLWGNPFYFEPMIKRLQLDPNVSLMYLGPDGTLIYASNTVDGQQLAAVLKTPGLARALAGEDVVIINYSAWGPPSGELIQVLSPVFGVQDDVVGIVRITYQNVYIQGLFSQFRNLIAGALLLGLFISAVLGATLAVNIGQPVQRVTEAIYDLARGARSGVLVEEGPREVRYLVRAVNYLVDRLNNLESARRQLLANLVHELGRPLGALRSAIHALSKGADQDPLLLNDLVTGMDGETARLQHLLEDLAQLHDQVLGTLELDREFIALSDWLPKVLRPWQEAAADKNLSWEMDISTDLPTVQVDPVRLSQVIGNLVSNAIRYTPAGRSVSIAAGVKGAQVWLRVSDTGPGIPLEEQGKIFEPFYRGDQGRRIKQGMGLGLSIARNLVEAHGGRLELESTPGFGSHFTAWIPVS